MSRRVERPDWPREERHRLEEALFRARHWQQIEPHKTSFWETFDQNLLAHYPHCRFEERDDQLQLTDFTSGGEPA